MVNFNLISVLILFFILLFLILFYNSNFFSNVTTNNDNISVWASTFECGFITSLLKINNFSNGIFILLVFFVVFDLEVSLLLNSVFQIDFVKNLFYYYLFISLVGFGFFLEVVSGFVSWVN
uniref:NADH-ubiquinone oxidoreductase chain 3 n=1 Tax=Thaparocleidus varicus TaxID=341076 RepID=A0A7L8ZR81_9PLAT|nr:NADH dehydrogenase subunit 3 [Thaparocleidus varicus]QOI72767.1 NADH dehydrogenase subunit 3 [Thaparocleidus varicus]